MKKLLFIVLISGFCIAGNNVRPRIEALFVMSWINTVNNLQPLVIETQPLPEIQTQSYVHQKTKPENRNNHYCVKRRNQQQNVHIHQPRSNNYAAKNRR